jgi:tRNA threonylcarbamoyladenosine biosynthesis protein TsaB
MDRPPTLLAFDTSAAHCAAALLRGGAIVADRFVEMGRGQAEELMPLLEEMLAREGLGWGALDALGVGTGPGNFTGIRIAVAAARGLALGLGVPAIGVSNFEAMAWGEPGALLVSLPGPRDTAYLQAMRDGRPLGPPRQVAPDAPPADPDLPRDTCVLGHAAETLGTALGLPARPRALGEVGPRIARIAAARLGRPLPRPAPVYVRPADAAPPADPAPVILP